MKRFLTAMCIVLAVMVFIYGMLSSLSIALTLYGWWGILVIILVTFVVGGLGYFAFKNDNRNEEQPK